MNEAIEEIRSINKWVVLLNALKTAIRLWYVTLSYLLGLFFVVCGLFNLPIYGLEVYEKMTVGAGIVAIGSGLLAVKK